MTAFKIFDALRHGGVGLKSAAELMIAYYMDLLSLPLGLGGFLLALATARTRACFWAAISLAMESGGLCRAAIVTSTFDRKCCSQ